VYHWAEREKRVLSVLRRDMTLGWWWVLSVVGMRMKLVTYIMLGCLDGGRCEDHDGFRVWMAGPAQGICLCSFPCF
jgi:hypothetical protein